jgi:1,2-phenylacetyl-CoA epoxidase catalytic subunit
MLWSDAQAIFAPLDGEPALISSGVLPEPMAALHATWLNQVRPVVEPIAGALPAITPDADGRRRRTDEFHWLHGELTMVADSEEGAVW